jgi:hypothetical protein
MKLKLEKFNVQNFIDFIKQIKLVKDGVDPKSSNKTVTVALTEDGLESRANIEQTFCKLLSAKWVDIAINKPKIENKLFIVFQDEASRIIDTLNQFIKLKCDVSVVVDYETVQLPNGDEVDYCIKFTLKSQKLQLVLIGHDYHLGFNYMTDAEVGRALAVNTTPNNTKIAEFELSAEDFKIYKNVMNLSEKKYTTIQKVGNCVYLHKSKNVRVLVSEFCENFEDFTKEIDDKFYNALDVDYYKVTICPGKVIFANDENDNTAFIGYRIGDDSESEDFTIED